MKVRPIIGRIVYYRKSDELIWPAIIVATYSLHDEDTVDLMVFTNYGCHSITHVHYLAEEQIRDFGNEGTWFWPPKI